MSQATNGLTNSQASKKKKPLPFDGKVITVSESQKIVERLLKHEEKKRENLLKAQREREERERLEAEDLER